MNEATEMNYTPEEIAKRLDTGIPTGPELVIAAECIRGLDELIQMQADRIEELERSIEVKECQALQERYDWLLERWDALPWEEIEARRAVFAEHPAQFPIDLVLMDRLLALREQGGRE